VQVDRCLLIRYGWLTCCVFLLLLASPVSAQEPKTELAEGQTAEQTVAVLPADSDIFESQSDIITLASSVPTEDEEVATSNWWDAKSAESSIVAPMQVENMDELSKFLIDTNSNKDIIYSSSSSNYQLALNNTGDDIGRIESQVPKESRFVKWADSKEKAATTFIPEGWSADLQIIRPYTSMTGFVFFARGDENTLVYVFQPFMPLYILPSRSLCETDSICFSSIISAEKVREMSLGNAPISVSNFKTPDQYFTSEVLPILTRNLNAYTVDSAESVYASIYGDGNSTDLVPAYDIDYNFNVENKKISGKAMVFTRNYTTTTADTGIWNGFIVGIESSENNFDRAFHQAAVTLLNLQFEEQWLNSERNVLLKNANTSQALSAIPELMANSTLNDFYLVVPTAAHHLARSQNNTMIADYLDKDSGKELHLPLFPELQYWYLNGDQLVGRDLRRDMMNASSLEPLF
jgi:hypothetical protein